jgi:hypothetical protein
MHSFEVGWGQLILWFCCADRHIDSVYLQYVPVQIRISTTQHAEVNLWWRKNYGLYGKGKSCPCPYHEDMWLHFFLTSELDGGECWHHPLATLLPGKKPRTHGTRDGVGSLSLSRRFGAITFTRTCGNSNPRPCSPYRIRYTDWATPYPVSGKTKLSTPKKFDT